MKLISAADLPKVDWTGKCDGFCMVDFAGQQQATKPVQCSYDPTWDTELLFHIPDPVPGPAAGSPAAGGAAGQSALVIQVRDWERIGSSRPVGEHVVAAADVAAMCGQAPGWEKEETVPVLRAAGGAGVIGYSKRPTTLRLRFRVLEGPQAAPPPPAAGAPKVP